MEALQKDITVMAPIDLYFWPTPNGWKITLMLEECGLPYDISYVDLSQREQFKPAFLKISPNGRMPAIVDDCARSHAATTPSSDLPGRGFLVRRELYRSSVGWGALSHA